MKSKFVAIVGLGSGLALGQGSYFLTQTWLIARNDFDLVVEIGIGITIISLLQWLADFGGVVILNAADRVESAAYIRSALVVRCFLSVFLAVGLIASALLLPVADVQQGILIGASFGVLVWALNLSGLIDSRGANQLLGVCNAFPWLFMSVTVYARDAGRTGVDGFFYGAAFAVGMCLTVVAHHIWLGGSDKSVYAARTTRPEVKRFFQQAAPYVAANLPAQLLPRYLLLIVDVFVGGIASAVYIYGKTIQNAAFQIVSVIRRVEFKGLCKSLACDAHADWRSVFATQKLSLVVAVMCASGAIGWAAILYIAKGEPLTFWVVGSISLLIPIWTFASIHGMTYLAAGHKKIYSVGVISFVLIPLVGAPLAVPLGGVFALIGIEAVMYIAQVIYYRRMGRVIWRLGS